jgi:hypothetical protein
VRKTVLISEKVLDMKKLNLFLVIGLLLLSGCLDGLIETQVNFVPVTDLSKYHMKIIPEPQTSLDTIRLVVYDDCQYNLLNGVTRTGNTIDIEKHFNSMMMLPCMIKNDTIKIGKLPPGNYTVNYKLVDFSTIAKNPVPLAIKFNLVLNK